MQQDVYQVKFVFIEDSIQRSTSWIGPAKSAADAEKVAREWFGFEKDHIQVLSCEVD